MAIKTCFIEKNKISYYKDFPVISEKFQRKSPQKFCNLQKYLSGSWAFYESSVFQSTGFYLILLLLVRSNSSGPLEYI